MEESKLVRYINIATVILLVAQLIAEYTNFMYSPVLLPFTLILTGANLIIQGSYKAFLRLLRGDERRFIIVNGISWVIGALIIIVGITAFPNPFITLPFISNERTLTTILIVSAIITTSLETVM